MEQLQEAEKQLADIEELLKASPDDESLLSVKNDLIELIALTKAQLGGEEDEGRVDAAAAVAATDNAAAAEDIQGTSTSGGEVGPPDATTAEPALADQGAPTTKSALDYSSEIAAAATAEVIPTSETIASEPPKKKAKKIQDFQVPERLIPLETDSEAEVKRKRRAIKALKREHRTAVQEVKSQKKQNAWQSFQKKKKVKVNSIFETQDGDAKVGVVVGRSKTSFNERTRHTY